jgi:phage tail-like protein
MDGTDTDAKFKEWFQTMFLADGSGTAATIRKNGSIVKKQFGQEVMRFAFEGAWIKSSKFADFDAKSDGLLTQTIVLAIERMHRV